MVIIYHHLDTIDYTLTNGCTKPVKSRLDNNKTVITKLFNNEQGNLTLVNEYICYKLALVLQLPVTKSGICICDVQTTDPNNCILPSNYGPCFYSTYIEKSTPLKTGVVRLLSNINIFYRLLLFDHIIYNKDRNIFNLLTTYTKTDISFRLIDHSHVFKNETLWDANCFKYGIQDFDIKDTDILLSNQSMYTMFLQSMSFQKAELWNATDIFAQTINEKVLHEIINQIPPEWNLSKENSDALIEYLLYRVYYIKDICNVICSYWKIL